MVIVPVEVVQVGWRDALAVGTAGVAGCALIVTFVPEEIHPAKLFAVTVYVPEGTSVNKPVVLV